MEVENLESLTMEDQTAELNPPGLMRAFTIRNTAARQAAVTLMPSRQLPYNTMKLNRSNSEHDALLNELMAQPSGSGTQETQAEIIVREMEQHQQLMEDNPEAEVLRREALRDLPQSMTMKRHVRAKLSASVSLRSKRRPISCWKRMKYRVGFAWKRAKNRIKNLFFSIEPWYEAIRKIEGNFGSAVGSYFHFLRWLVCANAVFLAFILAFIVIPQALYDVNLDRNVNETSIGFVDFISGKGYLEHSLLFYGHYTASHEAPQRRYNMSYAYFFTMACLYMFFFGLLCYKTSYSYRVHFIETGGGVRHVFANKVFAGWDFSIASDHAAALNARSIYNELKELLSEQERQSKTKKSFLSNLPHYLVNILINTTVISIISGLLYGLWKLLSLGDGVTRWDIVVSSAAVVCISVCPIFFTAVVRLEYYTPRVALYVTLGRTWLLDVSTLVLLLYFWTKKQGCWETSFGQEAYRLVILESFFSLLFLPIFEFIRGFIFKYNPKACIPEFNIAYNSLTLISNQAILWFGAYFSPLLAACVAIKFLILFNVKQLVAWYACVPANKVWRAAQTQTVMYMLVTLSLFCAMIAFGTFHLREPSLSCGPFSGFSTPLSVPWSALGLAGHEVLTTILGFITRPGVVAFAMVILCVVVYYARAKSLAQRSMVDIFRQMLALEAKDKDFLLNAIVKVSNGEWMYSPNIETPVPHTHILMCRSREYARAGNFPGHVPGNVPASKRARSRAHWEFPGNMPDWEFPGHGNIPAAHQYTHTWNYLHDGKLRKPHNAGYHLDVSHLSQPDRSRSHVREGPSYREGDGDTDSSFSWQGSNRKLNDLEDGQKKLL